MLHLKPNFLKFAIAVAAPAAFAGIPDNLDGVKMAMEYRADNWDMFTNIKIDRITFRSDGDDTGMYRMEGMLSWYNNLYLLDAPVARWDAVEGVLTVDPEQPVIEREDITWSLFNMATDEEMNTMPVMFRADDEGVLRHVSSERINGQTYTSTGFVLASEEEASSPEEEPSIRMLYMLLDPVIHPYNGYMRYNFVAQNGREYQQEAVVYSWVHGSNLVLRNWSDTGFSHNVFFTIDAAARTVTATNQLCLHDPDMLGDCVLSEATADGQAVVHDSGAMRLQGTFSTETVDGVEQTVITFPVWGCFNDRGSNFFVPTTDTRLYLGYNLLDPPASVNEVEVSAPQMPDEYYNLQGVRVVNPSAGLFIRRCGNTVEKVLIK